MSPLRIGIIAGEVSGDVMAAECIKALKAAYPGPVYVEGVAGPALRAAGCKVLCDYQELAVMGLFEVIRHLPRLWRLRARLIRHFLSHPPDLFIGVDAPDFNLTVARTLRQYGIRTVHYVSPSVWAWRAWRVPKIAAAVELMLTLFPFETEFYAAQAIQARCVGHPLADTLPMVPDRVAARRALGLASEVPVLAVLPGSRRQELLQHAALFLQAAKHCHQALPTLQVVIPLAHASQEAYVARQIAECAPDLPVQVAVGTSQQMLTAADAVLLASGTATLEAMLLKRPMVVAYRLHALSYFLLKRLVKVPYIALPNLLVGQPLVPEFIQHEATPIQLSAAVLNYLREPALSDELLQQFAALHRELKRDASRQAAEAVLSLVMV